jgi:hypothetical protein
MLGSRFSKMVNCFGSSFRRVWVASSQIFAVTTTTDFVGGQAHVRLEPIALGEAWYSFRPAIAVFAGASLRVEASPDWQLLSVNPRVGARFALRRRFWTAVLAEVPAAGSDRTDVVASVFLGLFPG